MPQGGVLPLPYRWQWRFERWKNSLRQFFGGSEQQPRPKLCPACGALVGISATRCHECGASLRFSLAALSKALSGIFGGAAPVTTILLVVNILIFGVNLVTTMQAGEAGGLSILWGLSSDRLTRLGATNPVAIFYGHQWYRLVTAMFLHSSLLHIGFNMMVLMDVGPAVEELYGSSRYLFLYIATGVTGFILSSWRGYSSVGASGAILGLIGLMIAITTKRGGSFMRELRSRLITWVVIIFVLGIMLGGMRTDNWAHFGGVASGFGLGRLFADRQPMNSRERQTAYALGWSAGIVVLISFVFWFLHFKDSLSI
jgi:rhomboid protease GluP